MVLSLAVKILLDRHAGDPQMRQRFLEEAQVMGQLQHPGVPAVHQLGTFPDGRPYLAMKLIKGHTLARMLAGTSGPSGMVAPSAVGPGKFLPGFVS